MASMFELLSAPSDGISSVIFSPEDTSLLLTSSWDKNVRLYNIHTNLLVFSYSHKASVLGCGFEDSIHVFSGGLDRQLKYVDVNTSAEKSLGSHDDAISCLAFSKQTGNMPAKIYSMDITQNKLVVAMAERHVFIYDIRNMNEPLQRRESSLKYMTRTVRCMPNGDGYAISSVEGRVAVEYFDSSSVIQAKKYAFKCHRQKLNDIENVYPVNALAFHPTFGTFVSGGGDGTVSIWDGVNKKRNKQYPKFPTSISSLAFSCDGKQLAIGSSYNYEEGEKDHPPDSIFILNVGDEAKPKTRE
ncbi:mitotic spindle checkpoint protein Bub3 [Nowakowskiella sp. JEL0078]|nr:mitotic spindle checkpoint protein Bub3 [Nowakowskiella sp. JEL0078]